MQMHDDSVAVILRSRPPATDGFKAVYQIIRHNPDYTFSDFIGHLANNGLLSTCPYETELPTPGRARVWLHFDGAKCLSTRVRDQIGSLILSDPVECLFTSPPTRRPCA
jgi:hypothetical protein